MSDGSEGQNHGTVGAAQPGTWDIAAPVSNLQRRLFSKGATAPPQSTSSSGDKEEKSEEHAQGLSEGQFKLLGSGVQTDMPKTVARSDTGMNEHVESPDELRLEELGLIRKAAYRICQTRTFEIGSAILIFVNFVITFLQVDSKAYQIRDPNHKIFEIPIALEHLFLVLFIAELLVRILGSIDKPWKDKWIVADSVVVGGSVVDLWILDMFFGNKLLTGFPVLRTVRAFRVLQLLLVLRITASVRLLAETLGEAFLDTAWIMLLMIMFTFCAAIVFTGTVGVIVVEHHGVSSDPSHLRIISMFDSVLSTMVTLNIIFLRGFYWKSAVFDPIDFHGFRENFVAFLLLAYIVFALMCLVNLISGMFISSIVGVDSFDESSALAIHTVHDLQNAFGELDTNGDRMLTLKEFKDGLEKGRELCRRLQIDPNKAASLFSKLDVDDTGSVSIDEFLIGILKETQLSMTVGMMSLDQQQCQSLKAVQGLEKGYREDLAEIKTLMSQIFRSAEAVADEMGNLIQVLNSMRDHPDQESSDESETDILERQANFANTPEGHVMDALQTKFEYRTRADRLENLLKDLIEDEFLKRGATNRARVLNMAGEVAGSSDDDASALHTEHQHESDLSGQSRPSDDALSAIWSELFETEIMPWVRTQLALNLG